MFKYYLFICEAAIKATRYSKKRLTYKVLFRDLYYRLRSLRNVEAYRSAIKVIVLLVLIRLGRFRIKYSRLRSASNIPNNSISPL